MLEKNMSFPCRFRRVLHVMWRRAPNNKQWCIESTVYQNCPIKWSMENIKNTFGFQNIVGYNWNSVLLFWNFWTQLNESWSRPQSQSRCVGPPIDLLLWRENSHLLALAATLHPSQERNNCYRKQHGWLRGKWSTAMATADETDETSAAACELQLVAARNSDVSSPMQLSHIDCRWMCHSPGV